MIVYFSLATGEDQTSYFESMGYVPTKRWADQIEVRGLRVSSWGHSGSEVPCGLPVDHPLNLVGACMPALQDLSFDGKGRQTYVIKHDGNYLLEVAGASGNGVHSAAHAGKGAV